jgi:hypothetical protein
MMDGGMSGINELVHRLWVIEMHISVNRRKAGGFEGVPPNFLLTAGRLGVLGEFPPNFLLTAGRPGVLGVSPNFLF